MPSFSGDGKLGNKIFWVVSKTDFQYWNFENYTGIYWNLRPPPKTLFYFVCV